MNLLVLPDESPAALLAACQALAITMAIKGPCSSFGGPADDDTGDNEQIPLALQIPDPATGNLYRALDLDVESNYCAMRWNEWANFRKDGDGPDGWHLGLVRNHFILLVSDTASLAARPVDYGPNAASGRIIDLSPGLARRLGVTTDSEVQLLLYRRDQARIVPWQPA